MQNAKFGMQNREEPAIVHLTLSILRDIYLFSMATATSSATFIMVVNAV